MSRFPQRWRTQRNAIRNANCKTSWIIKILNAHCAFGIFPVACLFECLWTPLSVDLLFYYDSSAAGFVWVSIYCKVDSCEMFVDVCWASTCFPVFHRVFCVESWTYRLSPVTLYCVERVLARSLVFDNFNTVNWRRCFLVNIECKLFARDITHSGSQIKQEDPPNLSI